MDIFNKSHVKQGEIKLTKEYKRQIIFSYVVYYGLVLIIILAAIGAGFAIKDGPIRTSQGVITPSHETVNAGDMVVITKHTDKHISRIISAVSKQDVIVGQVVAGPYGQIMNDKVKTTTGELKEINLADDVKNVKFLEETYIIRPRYQSGKEGKDLIVSEKMVQGVLNSGNYHSSYEVNSLSEFTEK